MTNTKISEADIETTAELDRLLALDLPGLMAELRQNKVKGERANSYACPIAKLVRIKLKANQVSAGTLIIVDGKYCKLSSVAMTDFIRRFDKDMPELREFSQ